MTHPPGLDKNMTVREAGREALKFVGRLLLSALSTLLLVYFGYLLINDVTYLMDYSEQGALQGIQYFSNK